MLINYFLVYQLFAELIEKECLHKTIGAGEAVKAAHSDHSSLHRAALVFHKIPLEEAKLFDNWIHFVQNLKHFPHSFVLAGVVQVEVNVSAKIL